MKGIPFFAISILLGASPMSNAALGIAQTPPPERTPQSLTRTWLTQADVALSSLLPKAKAAAPAIPPHRKTGPQAMPISLSGADLADIYNSGYNPGNLDTAGWWSSY